MEVVEHSVRARSDHPEAAAAVVVVDELADAMGKSGFETLPTECQEAIFRSLKWPELVALSCTSRTMQEACGDDAIWKERSVERFCQGLDQEDPASFDALERHAPASGETWREKFKRDIVFAKSAVAQACALLNVADDEKLDFPAWMRACAGMKGVTFADVREFVLLPCSDNNNNAEGGGTTPEDEKKLCAEGSRGAASGGVGTLVVLAGMVQLLALQRPASPSQQKTMGESSSSRTSVPPPRMPPARVVRALIDAGLAQRKVYVRTSLLGGRGRIA